MRRLFPQAGAAEVKAALLRSATFGGAVQVDEFSLPIA
jgi:hypothetical protein